MGDIETMKLILDTQYDKDVRDAMGGTAMHIAIFNSNFEAIELLLAHGFDIDAAAHSNGYTPLHYCVWLNNANIARFLISHNADRTIKDKDGMTPLERATKEGKRDMILALSRR
jgi:ankyrin repeat protein